jgi:DNA polymerase III gamma/tau subunit
LLSNQAQSAFLKILEETPNHAYIILCTTDPQKLLPTVKNRCSLLTFNAVSEADLVKLCKAILSLEEVEMSEAVLEALASVSDGSPRQCLVKLDQLRGLPNDEIRLKTLVQDKSFEAEISDLCKLLMSHSQTSWKDIAKVLVVLHEKYEPETIRYAVLGWCNSALLKGWGSSQKAAVCIEAFQYNTYDSKKAGLTYMCFNAWSNSKNI